MTLIPNTTQMPNFYLDDVMYLLHDTEWKALCYAVRKIYGFEHNRIHQKGRISLEEFMHGWADDDGNQRSHGVGASLAHTRACINLLVKVGILVLVRDNDRLNRGREWALQRDPQRIDFKFLHERRDQRAARYMNAASTQQTGGVSCHGGGIVSHNPPPTVSQQGGMFSHTGISQALINKESNKEKNKLNMPDFHEKSDSESNDQAYDLSSFNENEALLKPVLHEKPVQRTDHEHKTDQSVNVNLNGAAQKKRVSSRSPKAEVDPALAETARMIERVFDEERGTPLTVGRMIARFRKEAKELALLNPTEDDVHNLYRVIKREKWFTTREVFPVHLTDRYTAWVQQKKPMDGVSAWKPASCNPAPSSSEQPLILDVKQALALGLMTMDDLTT